VPTDAALMTATLAAVVGMTQTARTKAAGSAPVPVPVPLARGLVHEALRTRVLGRSVRAGREVLHLRSAPSRVTGQGPGHQRNPSHATGQDPGHQRNPQEPKRPTPQRETSPNQDHQTVMRTHPHENLLPRKISDFLLWPQLHLKKIYVFGTLLSG